MTDTRPPKLAAADSMKEMMSAYYLEAKNAADNNRRVAWITGGGPVELLIAMDVIPIYPENHAAMCGAYKMGVELCEVAEGLGYSRDICSYARSDIGSAISGKSPVMGLPKPDFLLCCSNTCGVVIKWYEVLARLFGVPLIFIDTPFIHDTLTENGVAYVKQQFDRAIQQMEEITGSRFDIDRLAEVVDISGKSTRLWGDVLLTCKNIPSPMSAFDGFVLMGPVVTLRGRPEVVGFYESLLEELKQRLADGVAAVPGEKYRLLWDNLPIWFKMRDLSKAFAELKTCIAASTYLSGWVAPDLDSCDPIDSMARVYSTTFINTSIQSRAEMLRGIVQDYSIDGIIFHSNRSCRPYSLGQYDIRDILAERIGVSGLVLEGDMNDERAFADGPALTRIEAFIETLRPKRAAA